VLSVFQKVERLLAVDLYAHFERMLGIIPAYAEHAPHREQSIAPIHESGRGR
jgi:hypothetical protein